MDREGLPAFATDPVDSAAAGWERWLNRFTNFAVAKNIADARRLKAILLHYVGEDVFELSESLGIVSDTPFEDVASIHSPCVESPEGVQHVSYGEYEALNMIEINNATTVDPYMCALKINGVSASMEIDAGTAATIISSKQYELIKQGTHELQLSTANVPTLRTYAGQTIKPAGGVTVDVLHQGCTHRLTCLVVN